MTDFELTDLLIELEDIQRQGMPHVARGQEVADLLALYEIPTSLYVLRSEPLSTETPSSGRRMIALFNFGLVDEACKPALIECLFLMGHSPEFISAALGDSIRQVATSLQKVVHEHRALRAAQLRANPQRFRTL